MRNALVFSPSFNGHRQVYVFVIAHVLNKLNYKIFIAGNFSEKIKDSFYIDKLKNNNSIQTINTSNYQNSGLGLKNSELIDLQNKNNIELTIFCDADYHFELFNSQLFSKKKRFNGKNIGIFIRPFYFYHKRSIFDRLKYLLSLKNSWKFDSRLFHEFLNPNFGLLDVSLHIDDYFASKHKKVSRLPDVFQQYADSILEDEKSDQRIWIEKVNSFKQRNKGRFIVLYFGAAQRRRGYDLLLKLAVEHDACFIHCGLNDETEKYTFNVSELKSRLEKVDRILETNQYISDPKSIEHFFKSASHLILPYRNFLGSSGVMLQALGYNIPVLVPDYGVMGYRVKKYNLGLTFDLEDPNSFNEQFKLFIKIPAENYSIDIKKYMQSQSLPQLENTLIDVLSKDSFV